MTSIVVLFSNIFLVLFYQGSFFKNHKQIAYYIFIIIIKILAMCYTNQIIKFLNLVLYNVI